jgi:rubrerythrin
MTLKPKKNKSKPTEKEHLKFLIKDEHAATKEYAGMSKEAKSTKDSATLASMSKDEARHEENLKKMLKKTERLRKLRHNGVDY